MARGKQIDLSFEKQTKKDGEWVSEMAYMTVPAKNQMCDCCGGEGKVDNPAFDNGITQSDREEMGEESFQNYMDGMYDVSCPECKGAKIVLVPDVDDCTFAQKRFLVGYRNDLIEQARDAREARAMERAENWMFYQ